MGKCQDIEIGSIRAKPGTKANGYITLNERMDGSFSNIPLIVVNGKYPGPVLWVQAGMHGDEYNGIDAILRIVECTSPKSLKGTLIALPVSNIIAFERKTRINPIDNVDLNRIFPGNSQSTFTSRAASLLIKEIRKHVDSLLDLHSSGAEGTLPPFSMYPTDGETGEKSQALARAFGTQIITPLSKEEIKEKNLMGNLCAEVVGMDIPAIMVESGGEGRIQGKWMRVHFKGIMNVMKYLGMIRGKPQVPKCQVTISRTQSIRANHEGILRIFVRSGKQIKKGQLIARVVNLFADTVEEVIAPTDGIVLNLRTSPTVSTGDRIVVIGKLKE